ncbi:MAG: hypothetical protein K0V04_21695, partial [Deltaproteobacteria bacterium]|nr:hypothetical protein [Deltaproteobacteria bacterium]
VPIGAPVVEIYALELGHLVRTSTGNFRAWGTADSISATNPPISVGFQPNDPTPADVGDLDFSGIEMDNINVGSGAACSVQSDGALYCWGYGGGWGTLGIPGQSGVNAFNIPADIPGLGTVDVGGPVTAVESHAWTTCAALADGTMRCWGQGNFGGTARGNTETIGDDEVPATGPAVDLGEPIVAFGEAGYSISWCALLQSGALKCWGHNGGGQLGYGHTENLGDDPGEVGPNLPAVQVF